MTRILTLLATTATLTVGCSGGDESSADDCGACTTDYEDPPGGDTDTDTDADSDADTDADTDAPPELAIAGSYLDQWGVAHEITTATWTMTYPAPYPGTDSFAIAQYDNDEAWLVAQNGAANAFNPNLWSRFDWTGNGGDLWYCQTAFASPDQTAAVEVPAADPSDPAQGGCGAYGFAWTHLTP